MAAGLINRAIITGVTLLGVSVIALALWQNVHKRMGLDVDPVTTLQANPDYAPALIAVNDMTLAAYSTAENRKDISEGKLIFSEADADAVKLRAKQAFAKAPLNVKAITQIATADFLRTLNWQDRKTLMLAKARNARDRKTLMALSYIDMRGGNFDALLETLDLRHRLGNMATGDLQVIQSLSSLPDQRGLIEKKLARAPSWGEDYFRFVIPNWDAEDIRNNRQSLFIFLGAQDNDFVRQTLLRFYFLQLNRLGLYQDALKDWSALPEVQASGTKTRPLYNPDFKLLTAPHPFNWRTYDPSLALAEVEAAGGLYASSNAPKRALLAQQLITAPTGQALRADMQGRWQYRQQQGYFFWRLSCMPAREPFFDIIIGDDSRENGALSFDIPPLPEGCEFQDLQLFAEPGGFNQRISMRVESMDIVPRTADNSSGAVAKTEGRP